MPAMDEYDQDALERVLKLQKESFFSEGPTAADLRINRIDRCISLLVENQLQLCSAVNSDFGCRSARVTRMSDIYTSVKSLKHVRKNIRKWMRPVRRPVPFPLNILGASARIHYQPKGVVGIMSPWNVPLNVVFSPLADILGAGNRAMIKPSEHAPNTARLLAELFDRYFDRTEVSVITGGVATSQRFSELNLDHLIFTGSTQVGRSIMKAAAKHLTPVTLELGGKSPVIISKTADLSDAAEKIITGKAMNAGQVCISPDYCFVPEDRLNEFIEKCAAAFQSQYPDIEANDDLVSIINESHWQRIQQYLDDASSKGARVVPLSETGNEARLQQARRQPISLVVEPNDTMRVMQEEIFGPILCVIGYRDLRYCIDFINSRPRPLALYYFGKSGVEEEIVRSHTTAGGMAVNDVAVHFACDDLPFGGIGESGMGHFHGLEGFRTFSHAKSVFKQGFLNMAKLSGTLPPYGNRVDKLLDQLIKK